MRSARLASNVLCALGCLLISALSPSTLLLAQEAVLNGVYRIQQQSTQRYLDAHDTADKDFAVVTRERQPNATQRWIFHSVGNRIYTIQQQHTLKFLDAHDTPDRDFAVVLRPLQENSTQRWIVTAQGNDTYTIQQRSTLRDLDAHDTPDRDFAVVTRPRQENTTQRWIITRAMPHEVPPPPPSASTCTIVGRVEGRLVARECLDPNCTKTVRHILRQVSLLTGNPRRVVATSPLADRSYSFQKVEPDQTYVVAVRTPRQRSPVRRQQGSPSGHPAQRLRWRVLAAGSWARNDGPALFSFRLEIAFNDCQDEMCSDAFCVRHERHGAANRLEDEHRVGLNDNRPPPSDISILK